MTNTEMVALLREARKVGLALSLNQCATIGEQIDGERLVARIDAALAEHDSREADFRRERDDAVLAAIVARGG